MSCRLCSWAGARAATLILIGCAGAAAAGTVNYAPALLQGWNLLGNSTTAALNAASLFGDKARYVSVWQWDATTGRWRFYSASLDAAQGGSGTLASYAQGKGYDVLATIGAGEGYWVNATASTDLAAQAGNGFPLAAGNLKSGWNLVATGDDIAPAAFNRSLSGASSGTPANLTTLWAWDPSAGGAWQFYAPSIDDGTSLAAYNMGKGYRDFGSTSLGNGKGFWVNYPGAPASGGVTAPLAALAQGARYSLVYAATTFGIDQRKATAVMDGSGAMVSYVAINFDGSASTQELPSIGSASASELAGDDKIAIGRWNGGTLSGKYYSTTMPALSATQGFHYAIGVAAASPPAAGTAKCYRMTAATKPTIGDGSMAAGSMSPGSQAKIVFGASGKMAIDMAFTVGGDTVAIQTPGGIASPASFGSNGVTFYEPSAAQFNYSTTTSSGSISVYIFVAGAGSERLGMAYTRYSGGGGNASSMNGAAYFTETACS